MVIKKIFTPYLLALSTLLCVSFAQAAQIPPSTNSLTYQGRILKSDGSPLQYNSVSFLFKITDPTGQCVIYQEQQDGINMTNSGGVFDLAIGTGAIQYITGAGATAVTDIFSNNNSYTCGTCSSNGNSYTCSANGIPYTPGVADGRRLRVSFYDGVGWRTISPDNDIRSVPYSAYSAYSLSAKQIDGHSSADFILKSQVNNSTSCAADQFLTWNGTQMTCSGVSGANGGTVTNIATGAGLTGGPISNTGTISLSTSGVTASTYGSATQVPVLNIDQYGRVISATNATISGVSPGGPATGDLNGSYPNPIVTGLSGTSLSIASLSTGNFLKYNGTSWSNANIQQSDVNGLTTALNSYVSYSALPTCNAADHTLSFISPMGGFACTAISISGSKVSGDIAGNAAGFNGALVGDVTGTQGATVVSSLQGKSLSNAAPSSNQVLQYDGSQWKPATISATPSGSAGGDLTGNYPNPTLAVIGAGGSGTKITYDTKGRVTASTSLSASDIPALDWSVISSGKPTNLSGYGITDAIQNLGNTPSIKAGAETSLGTAGTAGRIYITTDTLKIFRDNGSTWDVLAQGSGSTPGGSAGGDLTGNYPNPTLAAYGTAGTYYKVTTDAKGRVTSGSASLSASDISGNIPWTQITAGSSDIITTLGYTPVKKIGDTMSGNLIHAANTGDVYTAGGNSNTVTVEGPSGSIGTSYVLRLPTSVPASSGQALVSDTSGNLSWQTLSSGSVTSVSATSPLISSGGTTPTLSLAGLSSLGTANQILGMNSGATGYEYKTVNGTANQVSVTDSAGSITLSTPQDIHAGASPTFTGMTLSGMTTAGIVKNDASGVLSGGGSVSMASDVSGTLPVAHGGTGTTSFTSYGVVTSGATSTAPLTTTASATYGTILQNGAMGPVFSAASYPSTTTANQLLFSSANNVIGGLGTAGNSILRTNASGVPSFSAISNDTFTQYALILGRTGGQTLSGGAAAGETLTLNGTSNAAAGKIILNPSGGNVGIGLANPSQKLEVAGEVKAQLLYVDKTGQFDDGGGSVSSSKWIRIAQTSLPYTEFAWGKLMVVATGRGASQMQFSFTCSGFGNCDISVDNYTYPNKTMSISNYSGIKGVRIVYDNSTYNSPSYVDVLMANDGGSGNTYMKSYLLYGSGMTMQSSLIEATTTTPAMTLMLNDSAAMLAHSFARGTINFTRDGKVGVGTTNPTTPLQVAGVVYSSSGGFKFPDGTTQTTAATTPSGSINSLAKFTSSSSLGNSLIFDNGTDISATAASVSSGTGGEITLTSGNSTASWNSAGSIRLQTGSNSNYMGGHLFLLPGTGSNWSNDGAVFIGSSRSATSTNNYNSPKLKLGGIYWQGSWAQGDNWSIFNAMGTGTNPSTTLTFQHDTGGTSGAANYSFPSGNVAIGNITPTSLLHVNGAALATAWNTSSDIRLKEHITEIQNPLDKILKLRGVEFDWRSDVKQPTKHEQTHDIGVIAQEVEKQFPEAVTSVKDGYKSVAYSKLISPVIGAIKELYNRLTAVETRQNSQARQIASDLDALKKENAELKSKETAKDKRISDLESRLNRLEKAMRAK